MEINHKQTTGRMRWSSMNNQVAQRQQFTVKQFVNMDATQKRFKDVLGKRAAQFTSSLVSLVNSNQDLQKVDAASVVNSAFVAASLDLPVNSSLGYMYIVPYGSIAQPQIGYKGYLQLAQRSGQYKIITVSEIYQDELISWDPLTESFEYELHRDKPRDKETPAGYYGHFELLNGFQKTVYWTHQQIDDHRKQFSQAGGKGKDNPKGVWAKHYDSMALKTVIKDLLTKWGPMTVDTQAASLAEAGDYEQVVKEDPRDVTPEQTEDNAQVQSLINSYNEAQQEQQTTKKATKSTKTKKTTSKGEKVDDNNVQGELLNDGTITPKSK